MLWRALTCSEDGVSKKIILLQLALKAMGEASAQAQRAPRLLVIPEEPGPPPRNSQAPFQALINTSVAAGERMATVSVQPLRHRTTLPLKSFHCKAKTAADVFFRLTRLCLGGTALAEDVFCRLTLVCA